MFISARLLLQFIILYYDIGAYILFYFQSMLDFDFVCQRTEPSVACLVYPFTGDHKLKFYWGHKEVLIPGKL